MSSNSFVSSLYNYSDKEIIARADGNSSLVNASLDVTDVVIFETYSYYIIGSLMTTIMVIGFSTNLAILYTYATNRKIRTVDNTLIIGLALSDIGQAIFGIPFVAVSSFSKHWIFGNFLCQYYAFITTSFGIAQIAMLTVIAMERYFVIVRHDRRLTNTPCRCVIMIVGCFMYGSTWATGPLVGWSGYKEEEIGIACCVKWEIKDSIAMSYTISLCTFGWFIPFMLIGFGYTSIACSIYKERNKRLYMRRQVPSTKTNRERKVAITVLIMIAAFFVSWTPYSAVSLWSAVGDFKTIPLWVQVTPAVFAKCSIIWNPLIYVARHENFRQGIKQSFSHLTTCIKHTPPSETNVINPCEHLTRRKQLYESVATDSIRKPKKTSVTDDNFVTYIESPARSSSSVFLRSPYLFTPRKLRRHFTYISTFDSSQQIDETSESEYLKIEQKEIYVKTQSTQTEMCHSIFKQTKDKFVQTDETRLNVDGVLSEPEKINYADSSVNTNDVNKSDFSACHKRQFDLMRLHEEEVIDEHSDIAKDLDSDNTKQNEPDKSRRSLDVLKKKRKELKQQLENIYKDTYRTERHLPERRFSQPLSHTFSYYKTDQSKSLRYVENRTGRKFSNSNSFRCIPTKPELHMSRSLIKHKQKSYMTPSNPLLPYHLQRRDKFRNKMTRERIISEPTEIEMKTFIYKPFVCGSQTINDMETDKELMMNTYFMNEKTTIVRQSTV